MTRTASNLLNIVLLHLVIIGRAQAQGTFVNLDFEAANVPDLPPGQGGFVAVADGVPGWTVYIGLGQPSSMGHNTISLGGADVEIYGPQWPSDQILQGSYTVSLLGSFMSPVVQAAAIGQTGQIPPTARSLQFLTQQPSLIQASFAGQLIPLVQISSSNNYVTLAGDISTFAGQTGELRFTGEPHGGGLLDDILFSSQSIPEPSVLALSALGALLLVTRFLRRRG